MIPSQDEKPHWAQSAVSWGQLLVAIIGIIGASVIALVTYEKRLVTLEERQLMSAKAEQDERGEMMAARNELSRKLDTIYLSLNSLALDLAKHQTASDRIELMGHREAALRSSGQGLRSTRPVEQR